MKSKLKVLFLSPEAVPFAKTGGLADVAGALPRALKALGIDVRLVLPYYRSVRRKDFHVRPFKERLSIALGREKLPAKIFETSTEDGIPVYLLEREDLYDRPNLYGNTEGDYYDNLERFTFFTRGALEIARHLSFRPHVIHCNDWQCGLVPALLKGPYRNDSKLGSPYVVFTIHNLAYQGLFPGEKLPVTGLSPKEFFHPEGLEFFDNISLLKAGIVYSRAVTTVSPTYAKEIQTPEYGAGMEGILRKRKKDLYGILNGADYDHWDPARDPCLPARYTPEHLTPKKACKKALIEEMGLESSLLKRPLLGMVTRLDRQKGLDLLIAVLDEVMALDVGLVILGSGNEKIQRDLREAAGRYPRRFGLSLGFNEPLARRVLAGADLLLIPSRYEPCGLTQMYALKYGTVPLVRATGGLEDTVTPFSPSTGKGTGFKFRPFDGKAFLKALKKGIRLFQRKDLWEIIMRNGMAEDFSWTRSAREYVRLYHGLLKKRRGKTNA